MACLRFSETLKNKRHELGLTIAQASSVLKLKEQVLIAFEEGNFENMPKSGYAQGMLASYARYLGLSPRELVDMYSEELYEYTHGQSSHDLRRRTRDTRSGRIIDGYDVPNESESRPKAYVEFRSYLPTAGGPMGDYGAFATTSGVHSRATGAPVPSNTGSPGGSYSHSEYATGHAYNNTALDTGKTARASAARRRYDGDAARGARPSSRARPYHREDIRTRRVSRSQYQDDRSFDDEVEPYEAASTERGRRSSHTIARVERPNVAHSGSRSRDIYADAQRGEPSGGLIGRVFDWFRDPRHALAAVVVAFGLILTLIAIFSIKSCVSGVGTEASSNRTVGVTPAQSTADEVKDTDGTTGAGAGEQAVPEIAKPEAPSVVMVTVSVAEGQVSWLEIQADGESSIADTVTGPWERTYDVKTQLVVRAGDISAVSVFVNGEQRQFEMKSSGVGTITVDGPPSTAQDGEGTEAGTAQPQVQVQDQTEDQSQDPVETADGEPAATNEDGDEYQYTYNGYDIYIDHRNGNLYCIDPATGAKLNPADGTPYEG